MRTASKNILVCVLATVLSAVVGIVSLAQSQNAVGGGANGASVNVSATVLGIPANVSVPSVAPVSLPPQGGSFADQVASVSVGISPGVMPVLSTGLVINTTAGSLGQNAAHSESSSTINTLNILNGLITANTIRSKATSDGNGTNAASSGAGSFANQLRIAGILYQQSEFAPNTVVSVSASVIAIVGGLPVLVPLNGTVIINEQLGGGNGQNTSSLTVNFLHVNVSGSVAGLVTLDADIIVASASSSVNFTGAGAGNNPPSLNVPGAQTVQVGSALTFGVSGADPDAGDIVTLSASNVPSNAGFNQTSGNPANGQFSFTPSQSQSGQTFTVNFSAADNHGASVSRSVQITVTSGPPPPANNPPVLNVPGAQTVQTGTTLNFNVSGTDPDAGDTVTLSASNVPANAAFNQSSGNPASGQFSFTPSQSQTGQTFTVNFGAADNHGASVTRSVQITVTAGPPPANRPPSLILPGSQSVQVGATLTFAASATDPDNGDTVSLSASNLPAGSTVTPNPASGNPASSQFSFTPTQNQAGQIFVVNFTATDNHAASTSGTVAITVTPAENHPPIISVPGPQVIGVGNLLTFTVTASDPDGDGVALSASSVPPNATFNPSTGGFAFNPTSVQAGQVLVVTFTATDTRGASASGTVQITVTASAGDGTPRPPIISVPPSPIMIPVGQLLTFVVIGTSPVPGCSITLSSSGSPNNSQFAVLSGRFDFTPATDQQDKTFVVTFTATDCVGLTASATVTIVVTSPVDGILGPGRICVPITKITFNPTPMNGGCGFIKVSLTNGGEGNLTINSLKLEDGSHFRVEGVSNMPLVLKSASVLELKIMFLPKATGGIADTLTILTSDPDKPTLTIALKGKGKAAN